MKKFLLALAVLGTTICANAQETFAPAKGDFSTEIQFAPFSGSKIFSNGAVFQGRYFLTNKDALVLEIGLSGTNEKTITDTQTGAYTSDYNGKFKINLGYQRHFYTYKRLDLYAGCKVGFVHDFAANKTLIDDNNWSWDNNGTGNGFSAYALTGFDFYVYKGLYLGAEINVGFEDVLKSGYKTKAVVAGKTEEQTIKGGGHKLEGGFGVNPLIRLGWKF